MYDRYGQQYPIPPDRLPRGHYSYMNIGGQYTPDVNRQTDATGSRYTGSNDYGPGPFALNIDEVTRLNNNFRTALWTGEHLQLTLMSINPGEDIGLEMHPNLEQFVRIEEGNGIVKMGDQREYLDFQRNVSADYAFIIPAGKWHNLINTGNIPIKLYSIYAPPQHPYGTVHATKADAEAAERRYGY